MFTNHFQSSSFSEYCHLGTVYVKVIGSLPTRTKIMKNEIFRHGSLLEHLRGPNVNQLISYNWPLTTSICPELFQKNCFTWKHVRQIYVRVKLQASILQVYYNSTQLWIFSSDFIPEHKWIAALVLSLIKLQYVLQNLKFL